MAVITYSKTIARREPVNITILCPYCEQPMVVVNLYTKKRKTDWCESNFEGTAATCECCEEASFFSYDANSVKDKIKRFKK